MKVLPLTSREEWRNGWKVEIVFALAEAKPSARFLLHLGCWCGLHVPRLRVVGWGTFACAAFLHHQKSLRTCVWLFLIGRFQVKSLVWLKEGVSRHNGPCIGTDRIYVSPCGDLLLIARLSCLPTHGLWDQNVGAIALASWCCAEFDDYPGWVLWCMSHTEPNKIQKSDS